MKWLLIDNLMPNEPVCVNLCNVTDIKWKNGSMIIGYVDGTENTYECEKSVFVSVVSNLDILQELE